MYSCWWTRLRYPWHVWTTYISQGARQHMIKAVIALRDATLPERVMTHLWTAMGRQRSGMTQRARGWSLHRDRRYGRMSEGLAITIGVGVDQTTVSCVSIHALEVSDWRIGRRSRDFWDCLQSSWHRANNGKYVLKLRALGNDRS